MMSKALCWRFISLLCLSLLSIQLLIAQNENDCAGAIQLCDDGEVSFNPMGPGNNDFADPDNNDGCLSGENHTAWFTFQINSGADPDLSLGFTISPNGGAGEDYDFAVFGPDVECDNLGSPVRCSWAASDCSFCPETGLGNGATDFSEDAFGDGFVADLTVQPGETYILVVDNWGGSSNGFDLTWTGEAAPWLLCGDECELTTTLDDEYSSCQGEQDFAIELEIEGSHPPFEATWSDGGTGIEFVEDPGAEDPRLDIPADFSGEFWLFVTVTADTIDCEVMDSILITIHPTPVVEIIGAQDLCSNDGILALVGSPAGGDWTGAAAPDGLIDPSVLGPGDYEISYSYQDANGCRGADTVELSILAAPEVMVEPVDTICEGSETIELIGSPEGGVWSDPVQGSTLDPDDLLLGDNILQYLYIDDNGCRDSALLVVHLREEIQAQIIGPECLCTTDDPLVYEGILPGGIWSGIVDHDGLLIPAQTEPGTYTIGYESMPFDCSLPAMLEITIDSPPELELNEEISVCNNRHSVINLDSLIIIGETGGLWIDLDGSGASGPPPLIDFTDVAPGSYSFQYTTNNAQGACEGATDILTIHVDECLCPSVEIDLPDSLCHDEVNVNLDVYRITTEPGTWQIIETPAGSNPLSLSGSILSGNRVDVGWYSIQFDLLYPEVNCPDSAVQSIYLSALAAVQLTDTLYACNLEGTGNYSHILNLYEGIIAGDPSGGWQDLGGSGAVGTSDALDFAGVPPGIYQFAYTTAASESPCPQAAETLWVRVLDCSCPALNVRSLDTLCTDIVSIDLNEYLDTELEGDWYVIMEPANGNLGRLDGSIFMGENITEGDYTFEYLVSEELPDNCPGAVSTRLTLVAPPSVDLVDSITLCNSLDGGIHPIDVFLQELLLDSSTAGIWSSEDFLISSEDSLSALDAAEGSYTVYFETRSAQVNCPEAMDSVTLIVVDCNCPELSLADPDELCTDQGEYVLTDLVLGDEVSWEILTVPSGNASAYISDDRLIIAGSDTGRYELVATLTAEAPEGCSTHDTIVIDLATPRSASIQAQVSVCNNQDFGNTSIIDLATLIRSGDTDGQWLDIDMSSAEQMGSSWDFLNVPVGSYTVEYHLTADRPCADSSYSVEVVVERCDCPPIGLLSMPDLCSKSSAIDLSSLEQGEEGQWHLDGEQSTIELIDPSILTTGAHELVFVSTDPTRPENCPDSVSMSFVIEGAPIAGVARDTSICHGTDIILDLFELLRDHDHGGRWYSASAQDEMDEALDPITGLLQMVELPIGEYALHYRLEATGLCSADSAIVTLIIRENPTVDLGEDLSLSCAVSEHRIIADIQGQASQYLWTDQEGNIIARTEDLLINEAGLYILNIEDDHRCVDTDSISVADLVDEISAVDWALSDPLCHGAATGSIALLDIIGGSPPYSVIIDNEVTDVLTNLSAGEYEITIIDSLSCIWTETIVLNDPEEIAIDLGSNIQIQSGQLVDITAVISPPSNGILSWYLDGEIVCDSCEIWTPRPDQEGELCVELLTYDNCEAEDCIELTHQPRRQIYIPNVFSPNEDGQNDLWNLRSDLEGATYDVSIYDRWGAKVYEARRISLVNPTVGWDGRHKGQALPSGVYSYYVEITLPEELIIYRSGDVTLLR